MVRHGPERVAMGTTEHHGLPLRVRNTVVSHGLPRGSSHPEEVLSTPGEVDKC